MKNVFIFGAVGLAAAYAQEAEEEAQFVEDTIHNPFGLVSDEIETTQEDLDSVQACFD